MTTENQAERMKARYYEVMHAGVDNPISLWFHEIVDQSKEVVHGIDGLTGKDYSVSHFEDGTVLYFRFFSHDAGHNPLYVEFMEDEVVRENKERTAWLTGIMERAKIIGKDAPVIYQSEAIIEYLDQIAYGVSIYEASEIVYKAIEASKPDDGFMCSMEGPGDPIIPDADPEATFRSKIEYLPWLRLAAKELKDEYDIVVSPGDGNCELFICSVEDYHEFHGFDNDKNEDNENKAGSDEILVTVNDIFLKYGLGSMSVKIQGIGFWKHENAGWGFIGIIGNPYPGCVNDYANVIIEF